MSSTFALKKHQEFEINLTELFINQDQNCTHVAHKNRQSLIYNAFDPQQSIIFTLNEVEFCLHDFSNEPAFVTYWL